MEEFRKLLDNKDVDIARPENSSRKRYDKVDKEVLKKKLEIKEDLQKIQNELLEKTFEERVEWILNQKKIGDNLYFSKKFDLSLKTYLKALMGVKSENLNEKETKIMNEECKLKILTNMVVVSYESKSYKKGLAFLKQAEKIKKNHRVYYLYGLIYDGLENWVKAVENSEKAYELILEDGDEIKIEKYKMFNSLLKKKLREHKIKEKKLYGNIFKFNNFYNTKESKKSNVNEEDVFDREVSFCGKLKNWIGNCFKVFSFKKDKIE